MATRRWRNVGRLLIEIALVLLILGLLVAIWLPALVQPGTAAP